MPDFDPGARFVARHGQDILDRVLELADEILTDGGIQGWEQVAVFVPLFGVKLRSESARQLAAFVLLLNGGFPCALLVQYDPKAKRPQEQVDIRVFAGTIHELTLRFGLIGA